MAAALRNPYVYGRELHFPSGEALAEVMSYAHPSYREREANAKREYLEVEDARFDSAWALFDDAPALRRAMSARAYASIGRSPRSEQLRPAVQVEARLAEELEERRQDPRHHGFYDNRILDLGPLEPLVAELAQGLDWGSLDTEHARWRGPQLAAFMAAWAETDRGLSVARGPAERTVHERARALQIPEAQRGDRAIFRWMWAHAAPGARAELLERHAFAAELQIRILAFNHHHARLGVHFGAAEARKLARVEDAPTELLEVLEQLRLELERALESAEGYILPSLSNLERGSSLRAALGELPPIAPVDAGEAFGPWLQALMGAVGEVHGRLRTLHYKNLGQLLALHDQIEAAASDTTGS